MDPLSLSIGQYWVLDTHSGIGKRLAGGGSGWLFGLLILLFVCWRPAISVDMVNFIITGD